MENQETLQMALRVSTEWFEKAKLTYNATYDEYCEALDLMQDAIDKMEFGKVNKFSNDVSHYAGKLEFMLKEVKRQENQVATMKQIIEAEDDIDYASVYEARYGWQTKDNC